MQPLSFQQLGELLKSGSENMETPPPVIDPEEGIRSALEKNAADITHASELGLAKLLLALDILTS